MWKYSNRYNALKQSKESVKKQTFLKKNKFIHNKKNFYTFLILIKYSYVRVVIDLNFCMMISKIINKSFDWFEFLIAKDF